MRALILLTEFCFLLSFHDATAADSGEDREHIASPNPVHIVAPEMRVLVGPEEAISPSHTFIHEFINQRYERDLVTRFLNACPSALKLAQVIGKAPSTITKLKKPEVYGPLTPSAEALWGWLQSNDVSGLIKTLDLTEEDLKTLDNELQCLNLSSRGIAYDDLGDDIHSDDSSLSSDGSPWLVRDLISYLERLRGTFTRIDLSNNLISDERLVTLVPELARHKNLEEINLGENKISDLGMRVEQDLLKLPKLKWIDFSGNYGSTEETMSHLVSWTPASEQGDLLAKIRQ